MVTPPSQRFRLEGYRTFSYNKLHAPISDLPLDHNIIQAPPTPSPSNKGPSLTFVTSKRVELHFKFRLLALIENVFVACESFYLSSPSPSGPAVLYRLYPS